MRPLLAGIFLKAVPRRGTPERGLLENRCAPPATDAAVPVLRPRRVCVCVRVWVGGPGVMCECADFAPVRRCRFCSVTAGTHARTQLSVSGGTRADRGREIFKSSTTCPRCCCRCCC